MSGFPWDTFITAVVPAAGVLAGAALSGRQTSVASRTADLKRDYAAVVTAATALMEYRRPRTAPRSHWSADAILRDEELADAVQLACAVIDLAGSPMRPTRLTFCPAQPQKMPMLLRSVSGSTDS